ncbi:SAM-dependent methyltransferase [Paenibacillus psychroresistens]|nr:class I SAM-dependent methyltransferase [Paenibacillus psychroresistens]
MESAIEMSTEEKINRYYSKKKDEYNRKYKIGDYAHIHPGYFDKQLFPVLYSLDSYVGLKLEKIRNYMHSGQELVVSDVIQEIHKRCESKTTIDVLDCGAGHGATSISVAQGVNGSQVTALTLSRDQVKEIEENVASLSMGDRVNVLYQNVFDYEVTDTHDIIIGIDAFCQMGSIDKLFKILFDSLKSNGHLIIHDIFALNPHSEFYEYFNNYWQSDIQNLKDFISVVLEIGYKLEIIENTTTLQMPFWKLSLAYSEVMLNSKKTNELDSDKLKASREFHVAMMAAHYNRDVGYYKIILKKI